MSDTILYSILGGGGGIAALIAITAGWILIATRHHGDESDESDYDYDEFLGDIMDFDIHQVAADIENVLDGLEKVIGFADSNLGFLVKHIPNGKESLEVTKTIVEGVNEVVGKLAETGDDSE